MAWPKAAQLLGHLVLVPSLSWLETKGRNWHQTLVVTSRLPIWKQSVLTCLAGSPGVKQAWDYLGSPLLSTGLQQPLLGWGRAPHGQRGYTGDLNSGPYAGDS